MVTKMNGLSLDLLSHPGETLSEILESNHMTQRELAARIGMSPKHINQIIAGEAPITSETAFKLEKVFPLSASFWNHLQSNYDREKMQILECQEVQQEEYALIAPTLYRQLVQLKYIVNEQDTSARVIQMRRFFGVSNLEYVNNTIVSNALFRKSQKLKTDPYALMAWLKICELETNQIKVQNALDLDKLCGFLQEIKKLNTLRDPNIIVNSLQNIFAECGIAFAVVHHLKGAPVQGLIRKIDNRFRLCITLRNNYADIFWFTLFHEIGHLLDKHNEAFLDLSEGDDALEKTADKFASDNLLNQAEYRNFTHAKNFSKTAVLTFANEQCVIPGIVVGRLQHDGFIPHSNLNGLRSSYKWAEN